VVELILPLPDELWVAGNRVVEVTAPKIVRVPPIRMRIAPKTSFFKRSADYS